MADVIINDDKLCIIAGNGEFPLLFSKEANKHNKDFFVIALIGEADKKIEEICNQVYWINIGHLNKIIKTIKKERTSKAVMCGQVVHTKIFTEVKLDVRSIKLLGSLENKKTDTILKAVANDLKKEGVELISSLTFLNHLVPEEKGSLNLKPDKRIKRDIEFGYETAKKIAGLDIGQTVVVKDQAVVAVESLEGTDECIKRAASLAGDGIVVVKVSKPNQDERFDVPVLGVRTFNTLKEVKASAIAYESSKTLFLNQEESMKIAKENKIIIYGI